MIGGEASSGTVLITGAGLIGAHAARALRDAGREVVLYDAEPCPEYLASVAGDGLTLVAGDVGDRARLEETSSRYGVEVVVHTAGHIGARVADDPHRGVDVNVLGTIAAFEAARRTGATRFVFCSSMAVYDFDALPSGARVREDAAVGPKNLYGATKLSAEILLDACAAAAATEVVVLRLAGVFGRGRYVGGSWMGRVLNRVLEAALDGHEVTLETRWIGTNEFVYCKDVGRAVALACRAGRRLEGAYNIGTGELHDASQLVAALRLQLPEARIRLVESPAEETVSYLARNQPFDVTRAAAELGFSARYPLADALADYAAELRRRPADYERLG